MLGSWRIRILFVAKLEDSKPKAKAFHHGGYGDASLHGEEIKEKTKGFGCYWVIRIR
jgi:hypothetical protein